MPLRVFLSLVCVFVCRSTAEQLLAPPLSQLPVGSAPPPPPEDIVMERKLSKCVDQWSISTCVSYKRRGYCVRFTDIKKKCAKTCNACEPDNIKSISSRCPDKSKHCDHAYLNKRCRDLKFAKENCKNTCNVCGTKTALQSKRFGGRCGLTEVPLQYTFSQRIIGGKDAQYGSIPWQAGIYCTYTKNIMCGASLISNQYLLTAAHCFKNLRKPKQYSILLGKHQRNYLLRDEGEVEMKIKRIIIHPGYNSHTHDNDIALIHLETAVKYNTYIRPVCLPMLVSHAYIPRLYQGKEALVSGWGVTNVATKATGDVLQQVNVNIIKRSQCEVWLKRYTTKTITENMFCAGHSKGTKDSCQGDSGGPLVVKEGNQHYLVGVVSWGLGCGKAKKPGIYVKVKNYMDWILEKMI